MSLKETNLQIVENKGIFSKITNFFRRMFWKDKVDSDLKNNIIVKEKLDNKTFLKSIKIEEDQEEQKLLKIQREIKEKGFNRENVYNLTKDLTEEQKQKLEDLYMNQINELEIVVKKYKDKIFNTKNGLVDNN